MPEIEMSEIKFRFYDDSDKYYYYSDDTERFYGLASFFRLVSHLPNYPQNLEQFIGISDNQSKELYRGDIVRHRLWGIATVEFGKGTNIGGADSTAYFYGYYLKYLYEKDTFGNSEQDSSSLLYTNDIAILGNIKENAELLEN